MKPLIQFFAACLLLSLLGACSNMQRFYHDSMDASAQLGLLPDHRMQRNNHYVFPLSSGFYVAWHDPRMALEEETSAGTGSANELETATAALLYQQLAAHFPRVVLAASPQSMAIARVSAARQHLDYVIFPRLILLHDTVGIGRSKAYASGTEGMVPATGLAEDRAELQLTVIETATGRIVDVVTFDSRSGLLAMQGRTPHHLLHQALASYVDTLVPHS